MTTFKLNCSMGHEPMSWTVEAADKDTAYEEFMKMQEVKDHMEQMHADMAGKTPEEMKADVMGMISPEGEEMGGTDTGAAM